ncbi:MAG: DUF4919 domain-containing protein [Rikenellaceae bacterium]
MYKGGKVVINCVAVALMSLSLLRVGAAVPIEAEIIRQTTNSQSENYLPNLMLRFMEGDTTLTAANYHYLYYGFAYSEDYKPLSSNPYMDKFLLLASSLDADKPDPITLRDIIMTGRDALKYDPFNLKVWNMLAYGYGALGDKTRERDAYDKVERIIETIKATGSGVKERSARHILMFDHALDLLAADNLLHGKAMVISRTVEYVPFMSPQVVVGEKIKGMYFDFGRIYWNKPDSVTYKRERSWQFNNLKPQEYK